MAVPVSIDGKSILTLYYSTFQQVHKSKYNFYFNHPTIETGTAMNARESENYLPVSRALSASK
jgi:hypothetical protein